jgi:hypothetical protein
MTKSVLQFVLLTSPQISIFTNGQKKITSKVLHSTISAPERKSIPVVLLLLEISVSGLHYEKNETKGNIKRKENAQRF